MQILNHTDQSKLSPTATINPILRMFRNRPEHRFRGKIHEQISYAIMERNPAAALHISTVKIHHYGYVNSIVVQKDKINRNLKLLEQELSSNPDDPFQHYNIAVEYMRMNDSGQALPHLRTAIALIQPDTSYSHLLYKYETRCLLMLGQYKEALHACEQAILLFPDYTDLYHMKGVIQLAVGSKSLALEAFIQAVKRGAAPVHFHTEFGIGTSLTSYVLGQLLEECGDNVNAVRWYKEAIKHNSNMTEPLLRIFRILKCSGMEQDIPSMLTEQFHINSPEAIIKVVKALLEESCFQAASILLGQLNGEEFDQYRSINELKREIWSDLENKIRSAYFNERVDEALRLIRHSLYEQQVEADRLSNEAIRMSKTMIALADAQLAFQKQSSPHYPLYQLTRQTLPLAKT